MSSVGALHPSEASSLPPLVQRLPVSVIGSEYSAVQGSCDEQSLTQLDPQSNASYGDVLVGLVRTRGRRCRLAERSGNDDAEEWFRRECRTYRVMLMAQRRPAGLNSVVGEGAQRCMEAATCRSRRNCTHSERVLTSGRTVVMCSSKVWEGGNFVRGRQSRLLYLHRARRYTVC